MAVLVQKYGGSSVANPALIKDVAKRIVRSRDEGNQVAVVVSAMGDTTDELIALAQSVSADPAPRELDVLLSTGETVSGTLMAMALRELGADAVSMGGAQAGIRTDSAHGKATIVALDPARVRSELDAGRIVIVAGFQGITDDMDVTTLGRGGSDTTAVALAAALKAERCEVFTDVDGIYTADPRVVPNARKLTEIGYEEMLELASYGAKMHPRSIELGAWHKVPILVASSIRDVPGTLIHGGEPMEVSNKVSGVTYQRNVAQITIRAVPDKPGIAADVFEPLAMTT
jgi:aspartate kinase